MSATVTGTRCKFRCTSIKPAYEGATTAIKVELTTQYDNTVPEDQAFTRFTPAGSFWAQIDNPNVIPMFEVGKCYYLDITPAD